MSSWKTYGGINRYEKSGQINADSLNVNSFSLKHAFRGNFDICGQLTVYGNTNIQDSLFVKNDTNLHGNVIIGNPNSTDVLTVYSSSIFEGNITLKNDFIVDGSIIAIGDIESIRDIIVGRAIDFSGGSFLYSSGNALGLNTMTPTSAFDISTSFINAINVHSYNNINENILAQNVSEKGVIIGANPSSSYIHLYNDHSVTSGLFDASISLAPGGYLNIDVSKNVNISAPFSIGDGVLHPYNELLTVYDVSQSVFFGNIYQNNKAYTGPAASFIADSSGSNTFIYIGTPSMNGAALGGGAYPSDVTRSMSTIGVTDTSGSYTPAQIIVSGVSTPYYTTTGINTFKPRTDKYVLDINGPVHIDNGDIRSVITNPPFELYSVSSTQGVVVALGSSIDVAADYSPSDQKPHQRLITSNDNGISWKYIDIIPFGDVIKGNVLTSISMYNPNSIFITGSVNTLLATIDGGTIWRNISTGIPDTPTFDNININRTGTTISGNVVGYFSYDSSMVIFECPTTTLNITLNKQIVSTPIDILSIGSNSNTIYICGNSIVKYSTSGVNVRQPVLSWNRSYSSSYSYHEVNVFDNSFVIAVGGNIISSTIDGGSTWYDNSFNTFYGGLGVDFKSVYISDLSNAIAVGSQGNIWTTSNKGVSWNPIFKNLINPSGKADWLLKTTNNFRNVTMSDLNTIMITNTITPYNYYSNIYGNSQIFSIFSPNFINRRNNIVLDISGCSRFSGDLQINDNGSILSNSASFNLLNSDVQTIRFGGDANSIIIGSQGGNTIVNAVTRIANTSNSLNPTTGALIVSGGVGIGGNLSIGGNAIFTSDASFNTNIKVGGVSYFSNTPSTSTSSGAIVVSGGVGVAGNINVGGIGISGNVNVGGNILVSRGITILGNSLMSGNISVTSIRPSTNYSSGAFVVSGGAGIGGNLNVRGFSNFTSDSSFNGNLLITSTTPSLNVTSGALIVSGGVGIGGALHVNNDSTFNHSITAGNLYTNNNIYVKGGLYYDNNNTSFVIAPTDSVSGVVDIKIGRPTDTVTILGTLVSATTITTTTNGPTIVVNNNPGNAISYTAGIDIYDNSGVTNIPGHTNAGENIWAYMHVGQDLQSFVFKTPSFGRVGGPSSDISSSIVQLSPENRIRFSVNELNLRDISNNIRRGLVMIQPDADFQNYQTSKGHFYNGSSPYGDADYAINICPDFDISNILLKQFDTIPGVQTIGTRLNIGNTFSVYGNTNLYGNSFVYGNIVIGNSILGNAIFTNISGNVGIGRMDAGVLLDVSGSSRFIGSLVNTNYDISTFNSTYGSSWSERNINVDLSSSIQDIAMSYDGQYQYAVMYDKFGFGSVKKSVDFGSSWSVKQLPDSYSGNVIFQAVPFLASNVTTFQFQDLSANIRLPKAVPLNIQVGTYTASASSVSTIRSPWFVFDGSNSTIWQSLSNLYNPTYPWYTGTVTTNNVSGEYVQISLPYSFCLTNYQIYPQTSNTNHPKYIYTFGSNNKNNWHQLSANDISSNPSGNTFVSFQNSTSYSSYRFVITNTWTDSDGGGVSISRLDLSGIFQNTTGSFSSSITASADGKYITVANQGYSTGSGNIYTSSDFGVTYNDSNQRADAVWQNVAMSQRGNIQAAVGINRSGVGNILISSDYGSTWANVLSRLNGWQTISISSTGKYITAIQTGNVSSPKGNIWVSSDRGSTWSSNTQIYNYVQTVNGFLNMGSDDFNKTVCVSTSGQYQTALGLAQVSTNSNGVNGNANIWISSNYGMNWSDTLTRAPVLNGFYSILSSVSMNNSGQYQIASFIGGNTGLGVPTNNVFGGVLTSNDYGRTWKDTTFRLPSKTVSGNTYYGYFQKVISSYTGQFNMAMPKYQDISGNLYNNTNNTVVGIDNVFSSSYNTSGNIFSAQYLGSNHTGNVLQTHGLQVTVPILNNESLMMGYDVYYNSAYINSADKTGVNPIGINTTGGFVGIGTIEPSYTLDVSGSTNISGNLSINGVPIKDVIGPIGVVASFSQGYNDSFQTISSPSISQGVLFNRESVLFGDDITLNTSTGIFTLKSKRAYRLRGSPNTVYFNDVDASIKLYWKNITTGSQIGVSNTQIISPFDYQSQYTYQFESETMLDLAYATGDIQVALWSDCSNVSQIGSLSQSPWYDIEVIGGNAPVTLTTGPTGPIGTGPTGPRGTTGTTGCTGPSVWEFSTGSNIYYTAGNVGVGTTNPLYRLDVSGNTNIKGNFIVTNDVSFNGNLNVGKNVVALSFFVTSDYRVKTNVQNIYKTVDHLKPIEYDLIGGSHDMGFLAHEVQEIFPFLVSGKKDGEQRQSINYNGFIALLVKEVQDLKRENNSFKERLAMIEARLS